jgi:hypothetical protein
MKLMRKFTLLVGLIYLTFNTNAQFDPTKGCIVDSNGECVPNTVLTAMPFLRIAPDARGGAMGDVGIALTPDANSMHYNAANLVFMEEDASAAVTYTPWLRDLQLNDIFLAYGSGTKKIDDRQSLGFALRWFSLGELNFTDASGIETGVGRPREFEFGVAYARKLGDNLSASLTGKYIYSNLASGQFVNGIEISSATSFAADIGIAYKKKLKVSGYNAQLGVGATISNLGSKVSYTNNDVKDFLPANLGIGSSLSIDFDAYNTLTVALDINKLLAPTPVAKTCIDPDDPDVTFQCPEWDQDGDGIADYRQQSLFEGIFGSFGDAQGGAQEEFKEFSFSTGFEYWYDKQFAFRMGYYYENPLKGARQYMTVGLGLKYNIFGIDISYLVPTSAVRSPVDNTLRFGMMFDIANLKELDK